MFDCEEAERRTGITDDTGLRQHGRKAVRKAFAGAQARKFRRQHRRMTILPAGVPKSCASAAISDSSGVQMVGTGVSPNDTAPKAAARG